MSHLPLCWCESLWSSFPLPQKLCNFCVAFRSLLYSVSLSPHHSITSLGLFWKIGSTENSPTQFCFFFWYHLRVNLLKVCLISLLKEGSELGQNLTFGFFSPDCNWLCSLYQSCKYFFFGGERKTHPYTHIHKRRILSLLLACVFITLGEIKPSNSPIKPQRESMGRAAEQKAEINQTVLHC